MSIRVALAALATAALSGCASFHLAPTVAEIAASDDNTCRSYGYQFGTSGYAQCRMQIAQNRQAARDAVLGAYLSRPAYTPPMLPTINTGVNCSTVASGNMATTNCH